MVEPYQKWLSILGSHFLNKKLAKVISTPASKSLKKLHTAEENTRPQSIQEYKLR